MDRPWGFLTRMVGWRMLFFFATAHTALCIQSQAAEKPTQRIIEGEPMPLSAAAKKTLDLLQKEKIKSIRFDPDEIDGGFEKLKKSIEKQGISVRLASNPSSRKIPSVPLELKDIPIAECMRLFDDWGWWGWLVYDDGSITYFDVQCACTYPKDGLESHAARYEAGKPENMAKKKPQPDLVDPGVGYVPDEATAIAIAVAVLTARYGKEHVDHEAPYRAELEDGIWLVCSGKNPASLMLTPNPIAKIRKSSGAILAVCKSQ